MSQNSTWDVKIEAPAQPSPFQEGGKAAQGASLLLEGVPVGAPRALAPTQRETSFLCGPRRPWENGALPYLWNPLVDGDDGYDLGGSCFDACFSFPRISWGVFHDGYG